jgi:hypothetical protein
MWDAKLRRPLPRHLIRLCSEWSSHLRHYSQMRGQRQPQRQWCSARLRIQEM